MRQRWQENFHHAEASSGHWRCPIAISRLSPDHQGLTVRGRRRSASGRRVHRPGLPDRDQVSVRGPTQTDQNRPPDGSAHWRCPDSLDQSPRCIAPQPNSLAPHAAAPRLGAAGWPSSSSPSPRSAPLAAAARGVAGQSLGRGGGGVRPDRQCQRCSGRRPPGFGTATVVAMGAGGPHMGPDGLGRGLPCLFFPAPTTFFDPPGFLLLHEGVWGSCPGHGGGGRLLRRRWSTSFLWLDCRIS
jgi:hypothetical protein